LDTLAGLYVLVVDASCDRRSVLPSLLRYGGALVNAVDSAAGALELMRLVKPDLLVVALGVSASDARELIAAVRALKPERGGMVPAIAIGSDPSRADEARAHGFDAFLAQPVDRAELARLAARLIPPR
jgi:CheY-like chemotaxis protein